MLEFSIYEPISAYSFAGGAEGVRQAVRAAGDRGLHVRIHSPGGDPFEAVAMRSLLASYTGPLRITVDGLAASAATILLTVPGADVRAAEGSMVMIHNSTAFADGGASDMDTTAAMLRAVDGTMAQLYADATGRDLEEITTAMDAETWLTAEEAQAFGLVGSLVERPQVAASVKGFNLSMFRKTPRALVEKGGQGGLQENVCYDSPMDREIRKRLGLPESATEAEVFAALDRVSTRPPAAPAAPAVDAPALAQLVEARVTAALATHEASALHRDAVQAAVERFIREGKIAPAARDRAVALCGNDADSLNAAVAYWTSIDPIVHVANVNGDLVPTSKISARARQWARGAGVKDEYLEEAAK